MALEAKKACKYRRSGRWRTMRISVDDSWPGRSIRLRSSPAPHMPLKPPAQLPLQRPPRLLQPAVLPDPRAIHPAQFLLDRGQIDSTTFPSRTIVRPSTTTSRTRLALPRANNSCSGSTGMMASRSRRSRSRMTKSAARRPKVRRGRGCRWRRGRCGWPAKGIRGGSRCAQSRARHGRAARGASRGSRRRPRRALGRRRRPRWRSRICARPRSARGRNAGAGWRRNW